MSVSATIYSAPGYYYALAYSLAADVYIMVNPCRFQKAQRFLLPAAFTIGIVLLDDLTDRRIPALFVPTLLAIVFLVFLMIRCCCRIPLRNALYFTMRAFVLGEFTTSVFWQLYDYSSQAMTVRSRQTLQMVMLVITYGVIIAAALFLERRFRKLNAHLEIRGRSLLQTFLITTGVYLFSNISNVYQDTPFSSSFPREIMLIRSLADLGGVLILYAYHMQMQELDAQLEIEMLQQLTKAQYTNYQITEQSMSLVQQKYHDLKHQLDYLRAGIQTGRKEDVTTAVQTQRQVQTIDRMEQDIRLFEAHCETGNLVLDTILSSKLLQCQNENITMTCVVDGASLHFMEEMDLVSLFGNALDNAIESVRKITLPQERLIHVEVSRRNNFAVIVVGNSCEGTPEFADGLPQTSKEDKRYHGFGTRSIAATAEKYKGTAVFGAEDGWFELKVVLPIPSGEAS